MNCLTARQELATALLTRDPVPDQVAEHVASCPGCAAEAATMHPMVGLLGALDGPEPQRPPAADDRFLERLLGEAERRRTSRLRRTLLTVSGIAAAAVLVVGGAVAIDARIDSSHDTVQATASQAGIMATVSAATVSSGTDLAVSISGVKPDTHCVLRVNSTTGESEAAADWRAEYDGTAHLRGTVAAPADTITSVEVVDASTGRTLLTVPFA